MKQGNHPHPAKPSYNEYESEGKMTGQISSDERNDILERVERRASAYYYEFSGCAQMVILALQQEFKFPGGTAAFKAANYAGRGTKGIAGTCGALIGGVLAIGLASGRDKFEDSIYPDPEVLDETTGFPKSLESVRKYNKRFLEELGSWQCLELQEKLIGRSFDPENMEESEKYDKEGGREKCAELAGKAARLAAEIILEMPRR